MIKLLVISAALVTVLAAHGSTDPLGVFQPKEHGTDKDLRLQDFCIFRHNEYIYTAPMMKDHSGKGIVIARSKDYKNWEVLGNAIPNRTEEDSAMVWAPHVVEVKGVYHMFYTGVTQPQPGHWCQRILVASTKDPSKPSEWKRNYDVKFIVDGETKSWFKPSHKGNVWTDKAWADCRDPMVMKYKGTWYMFYSGTDTDGGITGVATAPDILGPWTDHGAVMKVSAGIPESCFVLEAPDGSFVMTFNHAGGVGGIKSARAKSLLPVEGQPSFSDIRLLSDTSGTELVGWAHEFLPGVNGSLLCANLTGYFVNFKHAYFHKEPWGWTITEAPAGEARE